MGQVAWSDFSWETFATLTTGVLAVGGAVLIGLRQVGIQARQSAILERQVGLDELKLRSDLFGRRFSVYEATGHYLGAITAVGDRPEDRQVEHDFLVAMDQAVFLFGPAVHEGLLDIYHRSLQFFALKSVMAATYKTEGHYGDGNPQKEMEHMLWLTEKRTNLAGLFGDMKLTHDT